MSAATPAATTATTATTPFLEIMTFATNRSREECDCCDECGTSQFTLPKRPRIMTRTQERSLIQRSNQNTISLWKLVLPATAEPLMEFGTTPRIVWVARKPTKSLLKSIGTGIIGSSHETASRLVVEWDQGDVYFMPSNGGKAIGWIHSQNDNQGPMELYWAKRPTIYNTPDHQQQQQHQQQEVEEPWTIPIHDIFQRMSHVETITQLTRADTDIIQATFDQFITA